MRRALARAAILALCAGCSDATGFEGYLAVMSGGIVFPPVVSSAGGQAQFAVDGNVLEFEVTVQTITGVTDIGLYAGEAGANGPLVRQLFSAAPPTGAIASAVIAQGSVPAAGLTGMSLDSLRTLMASGKAYVQVNTQSRPSGEIRGQIHAN